jgi:hypothetical protein
MDDKGQVYFSADDKEVPEEDARRLEEALKAHREARERHAAAIAESGKRLDRGSHGGEGNSPPDSARAALVRALEAQGEATFGTRRAKG